MNWREHRLTVWRSGRGVIRGYLQNQRGGMMVEYLVTVGCGLVIAVALVAIGPALVQAYLSARHTVVIPIP